MLKIVCKGKGTKISKDKNKVGGITPPDFNTFIASVIKILWYW